MLTQTKLEKMFRRSFRNCPGATFHEKVVFAPEVMLREFSNQPALRSRIHEAARVANWVAKTQNRYILDDEVSGAALAICETRGESLQKVLPHIRVPHQRLWIEIHEGGRQEFAAIANYGLVEPDAILPSHTGFLIETDESGRRGRLELAFFDMQAGFHHYPLALHFDLDNPFFNAAACANPKGTALPAEFPRYWASHNGEMTRSYLEYTQVHQGSGVLNEKPQESWDKYFVKSQAAVRDIAVEFRFLVSALGMISLRNGIARSEEPVRPLMKSAGGSLGRRLAMQTETSPNMVRLTMSLSPDMERDKSRGRRHANAPGRHWVCGHFKVRKTGVFWWSPHKRGDSARDLTNIPREISVINPPKRELFSEPDF